MRLNMAKQIATIWTIDGKAPIEGDYVRVYHEILGDHDPQYTSIESVSPRGLLEFTIGNPESIWSGRTFKKVWPTYKKLDADHVSRLVDLATSIKTRRVTELQNYIKDYDRYMSEALEKQDIEDHDFWLEKRKKSRKCARNSQNGTKSTEKQTGQKT